MKNSKQKTGQTVLTTTKALTKTTNCTFRAIKWRVTTQKNYDALLQMGAPLSNSYTNRASAAIPPFHYHSRRCFRNTCIHCIYTFFIVRHTAAQTYKNIRLKRQSKILLVRMHQYYRKNGKPRNWIKTWTMPLSQSVAVYKRSLRG